MLSKIVTQSRYLFEGMRNLDSQLLGASIDYSLRKTLPSNGRIIQNHRMGKFYCRANTTDFMYSYFAYEYHVKKFILKHSANGDIFFDIGACIGDYSVWMTKNNRKAFAFEPSPQNFSLLKRNVELNQMINEIEVFNYGLGEHTETLSFSVPSDNKGQSSGTRKFRNGATERVEIRKFDEVLDQLKISTDANFIVKIDVEGMEDQVLKGMQNFLGSVRRLVLVYEAKFTDNETIKALLPDTRICQISKVDEHNIGVIIEN